MKKITWIVLLLGLQALSIGASRCWAQSGTTYQRGRKLTCASDDGRRHTCRADTSQGVQMVNQRSGSPCIQDQTWGYTRRGVWVDRGCRADFFLGGQNNGGGFRPGGPGGPGGPGYGAPGYGGGGGGAVTVTCSSDNGKRNYCQANTGRGVQLSKQRSGSPCIQGQTWGYDGRSIWVDRGCRADFITSR
jgi:Protein of unknown function (DUF3011)